MTLQWGIRIATHDPRIGDVTALAFSDRYGLIATTGRGDWLTFDLRGGTLAGIKAVGIAPIRGATGRPTSVVDLYGSLSFITFAGKTGTISRYALATCGPNATGVPWLTTTASPPAVIVQGAYTYLGIVAADARHAATLILPYEKAAVSIPDGRNPFVPTGEHLVALANPAQIVPYILALTQPAAGPGHATLRLVHVEPWDDVRGGPPVPTKTVLTLDRVPSAMASFQGKSGTITVIFALPTDIPGTIDLYRFDGTP